MCQSACAQTRQLERAFTYFERMEAAGVKGNMYTYSALLAACENCEQPARAQEVFEQMQGVHRQQNLYADPTAASSAGTEAANRDMTREELGDELRRREHLLQRLHGVDGAWATCAFWARWGLGACEGWVGVEVAVGAQGAASANERLG